MRIRPKPSHPTWRKTLHALVCVAVVLSNLLSLLALTPQAVQAAAAPPNNRSLTPQPVESAPAAPVANSVAAPLAAGLSGSNVLTITKTVIGTGSGPFNITVNGPSGYVNNTTISPGTPVVLTGLASGVYTVTEASPGAGWTTVYTATPGTGGSSQGVVTLGGGAAVTPLTGVTAITGQVFRDFNSNGVMDTTGVAPNLAIDTGVAGVTVTAYDPNGNAVGSATSDAAGAYTISPTGNGPYRITFSHLPSGYEPTTHGSANGTSTQFVMTAGSASNVNFGINYPADYCQANPSLCTSQMWNGDLNATFPTMGLVKLNYNDFHTAAAQPPVHTTIATKAQIGATWGQAYARTSKTIYSAAFVKRHVGLGPNGLGAIYATDINGTSTTLFADLATLGANLGSVLSNSARGLGAPTAPNNDPTTYPQIGKVGLGGLAMSDDERTLYAISLNDKALYALNVPGGTLAGSFPIADPGCTGGAWRPFAVKFWHGNVYVGGVCDAQTSQNGADLHAYILRFVPATNTSTPVLNFLLNYPKGSASDNTCTGISGWFGWLDTYAPSCRDFGGGALEYVHPQPVLSNIEFDGDGSMIIGFFDRMGHQFGYLTYGLTGTAFSEAGASVGGDILRAYNNNGTYMLENNAQAGSVTTAGAGNNQGPGGGEFYYQDNFNTYHLETAEGGLALWPGRGEVVTTMMDPFDFESQGLAWFSNTTGATPRRYEIEQASYQPSGNGNNPSASGKANGLGDLEILCDAAPIEIGNRVWNDLNGNGIQDPGEPGLNGLTVSLQSPTNTVATVTSGDGNYYFNVSPTTAYTLTLTPPSGMSVTAANAASLTGATATSNHAISDTIDSDAALVGGQATIYYTTGSAGQNNHSLDFGFTQPVSGRVDILNTAPTAASSSDYGDAPDSYGTLLASNGPRHQIASILRIGAQIDGEADGQPSVLADGDNNNGIPNDEDGVQFKTPLRPGAAAVVAVGTHQPLNTDAHLSAWIDFNQDGHFDASEQIATDDLLTGNPINIATPFDAIRFDIPANALPGFTYARFRLCTAAGDCNTPNGAAADGEVEDYRVQIATVAKLGDKVWLDTNGDGMQQSGEPGVPGVLVQLYRASDNALVDVVPTDANGLYLFPGLLPDTYYVKFTAPSGYTFTAPNQGSDPSANSDANQTTGLTSNITLAGGANDQTRDAGLITTASQQTVCDALPWGATEISHTFSLPKFNPALGTLTGVNISTYAGLRQWIGYENFAVNPQLGRVTSSSDGLLTLPDSTTLNVSVGLNTGNHSLAAYDGINDFTGSSSYAYSEWQYDFKAGSTNYTSLTDFIAASPGQSITLPYVTFSGVSIIGGGGNIVSAQKTYALGGVCVNYSYTPAPPSTVTLVKQTTGGDGTFTFTGSDASLNQSITTAGGTGSSSVITLTAGVYTVTENALTGWSTTGITVTGDTNSNSTMNVGSRQAAIHLDAGENITVTYVNASSTYTLPTPITGQYCGAVPFGSTGFINNPATKISLPKFDPALGLLSSATLTTQLGMEYTNGFQNWDIIPYAAGAKMAVTNTLALTMFTPIRLFTAQSPSVVTTNPALGADDGSNSTTIGGRPVPFSATDYRWTDPLGNGAISVLGSGFFKGWQVYTPAPQSYMTTNPADLTALTGPAGAAGTFPITGTFFVVNNFHNFNGDNYQDNKYRAFYRACVNYTYTPAPPSATLIVRKAVPTVTNCAAITGSGVADPNAANNAACVSASVVPTNAIGVNFNFTDTVATTGGVVTPTFALQMGQAITFTSVVSGSYVVTEPVQAGWQLASAFCSNGDVPPNVHVAGGLTVTCTFTNTPALAQFGDRVWIENDGNGTITATEPILPVTGLVITATASSGQVYTATTDALGYYSFTVPANVTYTIHYGPVPAIYGNVIASATPGGNAESGNAGSYQQSGNPDLSHAQDTTIYLKTNQANWHLDFAFWLPQPKLVLHKYTNGYDADAVTGPYLAAGSGVTWTYQITNTGNVTLTNLTLADDKAGVITCTPTTLAPGVGTSCTQTSVATVGQYTNTAVVTGTPTLGPVTPVTSTNPSHYFGVQPSFVLKKLTNGYDADLLSDPRPVLKLGDPVTWTYVITNTGNVTMSFAASSLKDDKEGPINGSSLMLAPGTVVTVSKQGFATTLGQYTNLSLIHI